eukprot:602493-Prymnesium_polylepis.1
MLQVRVAAAGWREALVRVSPVFWGFGVAGSGLRPQASGLGPQGGGPGPGQEGSAERPVVRRASRVR